MPLVVTCGNVLHWSENLCAVGCENFCGGLEEDTVVQTLIFVQSSLSDV